MIIPIELRFKADKGSKSAFRTEKTIKSHDVNSVEFHITIDGLELTDSHTAKILSVFHTSKSQANVDCEIVEGKIIYKPDTNLISRHEHVTNYVYVYHDNQSLDVREFIYIVDLSKIDETSLEVKEVYDQSYADLLADFEQALNDYKDSLPQADSVRADIDEILNQFSEDSQAKLSQYDLDAQQVISDNKTAFNLAESVRQEEFGTSQSERQQQFDYAQSARQESYEQTQSLINEAESSRVQAEGQRESAESSRKTNEADRVQAEINRENAEDSRDQSEGERKANEESRVLSESERENAEKQRKTDHANRSAELDSKADKVVLENLVSLDILNSSLDTVYHVENNEVIVTEFSTAQREIDVLLNTDPRHIYYSSVEMKSTNDRDALSTVGTSNLTPIYHSGSGEWETLSLTIMTVDEPIGIPSIRFLSSPRSGDYSDDPVRIRKPILINLTTIFGLGNEPTKEEMDEFIKVTGYIDGEYALNNKEMLSHLMKGIHGKADKKQEDWITPTLLNGWEAQSVQQTPRYYKDNFGIVHMEGCVKSGLDGHVLFHLPNGYRSSSTHRYPASTGDTTVGRVDIRAGGTVSPHKGTAPYIYLSSVSFRAEA